MDSLKFMLYTLARIGLLLLLAVFSAFVGEIVIPSIVTLFPSSMSDFKNVMTDGTFDSVIGMAIMLIFFIWIFYDDGKRHAAYESWSSVTITIVFLLMLLVYFIPVIFRDSFAAEGKMDAFYLIFYYPCHWLTDGLGLDYMVGVIVGALIILAFSFASYLVSFKLYVRKHPVILTQMAQRSYILDSGDDNNDEIVKEDYDNE